MILMLKNKKTYISLPVMRCQHSHGVALQKISKGTTCFLLKWLLLLFQEGIDRVLVRHAHVNFSFGDA